MTWGFSTCLWVQEDLMACLDWGSPAPIAGWWRRTAACCSSRRVQSPSRDTCPGCPNTMAGWRRCKREYQRRGVQHESEYWQRLLRQRSTQDSFDGALIRLGVLERIRTIPFINKCFLHQQQKKGHVTHFSYQNNMHEKSAEAFWEACPSKAGPVRAVLPPVCWLTSSGHSLRSSSVWRASGFGDEEVAFPLPTCWI